MVMARCRECGRRVAAEDFECPHCGAIRPGDLSETAGWSDEPEGATDPGGSGKRSVTLALSFVAAGILALLFVWTGAVSIEALLTLKVVIAGLAAGLVVWWLIIRAQETSERTAIRRMGQKNTLDSENPEDENAT
jgi:hypothetical protein